MFPEHKLMVVVGKGMGEEERCCRRFRCADEVKFERAEV